MGVAGERREELREAAQEMVHAYQDIEGDVVNGRTDKAYFALRAALTPEPTETETPHDVAIKRGSEM